jgi:pimeloyl-ACP methyl ester carboxylesterase
MTQDGPMQMQLGDGRQLDVWTAGPADGETLVFHCGTPGSGLPFGRMVEELASRGLRYVSFSRPGYGDSTRLPGRDVAAVVDDTRQVLDQLGADDAWMLGWSGGGPHALACAALLGDRVRGTSLIAGVAPYGGEGLDWMAGMGKENVEGLTAILAGPEAHLAVLERDWPAFRDVTAEDLAKAYGDLVDDVDRGSIHGDGAAWIAAACRNGIGESYWGWYDDEEAIVKPWVFDIGAIRTPVHVWQGAHDRMVPFAHGEWLAANIGNACAHLHPEHGHLTLIFDSIPDILDEMILS